MAQAQGGAAGCSAKVAGEFRAAGGQAGGERAGTPLVLARHAGAGTGTGRVTPLGCFALGNGRHAVVASSGGSPGHPAWYRNLKARPVTTAGAGAETFPAVAEEPDGPARAALWPALTARYPAPAQHQAKTARQFPVLVLTRQDQR